MITAEALFVEHFLPLYPPDARADLARARSVDANPGGNPSFAAHLEEAAQIFASHGEATFGEGVRLDFTDASVHRLSAALTRARRDAWALERERQTLFNVVVHGAAYVGACAIRGRDARWAIRSPLWESLIVLRSRAGEAELAVFHWWLKALADDALEAGDARRTATLADRYRTLVEVPTFDASSLPVWIDPERAPPRLAKVRYDVFYKYLKAHLPEVKDVGRDFPSPERFEEMRLRWLEARPVGGGRMLLVSAAGEGGVHLFWLDRTGFQKAAFFPADAFPEPRVTVDGDVIRVLTQVDGRAATHEVLWWGP